MDTLLGYIKNIGFFLILVSVVCNALPENSYKKYCKLFCGLVLVVLVIAPFNEFLNYEGDISDIFIGKSHQSELIELEANLKLQDERHFAMMLDKYEESLREELQALANDQGISILDVSVNYVYADNNEDIELKSLDIIATNEAIYDENYQENYEEKYDENNNVIDNIKSYDINMDEIHIDDIEINIDKGDGSKQGIDQLSPGDRPKVIKLIEKVAKLLGIETNMINVTMKQ